MRANVHERVRAARTDLSVFDRVEAGFLDPVGFVEHVQVSQHHHRAEQQRRRVGLVLAGDVRSGAVHGFEDGRAVLTDVTAGRQAQSADQTRAQIAQDITVQIRHDKAIELGWVLNHLGNDGYPEGDARERYQPSSRLCRGTSLRI